MTERLYFGGFPIFAGLPTRNNPHLTYAKTLHPIMAMNNNGNRINYSVKTMPYINRMSLATAVHIQIADTIMD